MKNITRHVGILSIMGRLPSSSFGNPMFQLIIDGYSCVTGVDCMHGYDVKNYDGKMVEATIGTHYGRCTLNTLRPAKGSK